jgi:hypothetical protein
LSNYLAYWPGRTNQTNQMSVLAWAKEAEGFVQCFTAIILADFQTRHDSRDVARVARRFVSLTVSNHFAWNALRGAGKLRLVKASFRLAGLILGSGKAVARVAGVLLVPRPLLERLVLAQARRQARAAGRTA